MTPAPRLVLLAFVSAILCQCGAPEPPRCSRVPIASRTPADSLIDQARISWNVLGNSSRKNEWPLAQQSYNTAVAKLFDQVHCGPGSWDDRAAKLGTRIAAENVQTADPDKFDAMFPATMVSIRKEGRRHLTEGVGVPLVGWKKTTPLNVPRPAFYPPTGMSYSVNATLRFDGKSEPTWHFVKRWIDDDVMLASTEHTLAADWSAPNVFYWNMSNLDDLTIENVLLPDRFMDETGLYFLQPYDPKKIPLVMVHGLKSSPDAFRYIINDLAPEPWFREKYQIWLFNYPTGNPWTYTGIRFREYMNNASKYARSKGSPENLDKMVVLAHSMGGLVVRSSVTDPKTTLYDEYFSKPIDQLDVTPTSRKYIADATLYKPLKEPKRVVFMAVPHGGSPLATLRFALMTSNLIRLPKALTVDFLAMSTSAAGDAISAAGKPSMPTSITSLSPNSRSIKALAKMPLPKTIHFHSIIGNRGKGKIPDCSDGVVPYKSSRVMPVESEIAVPWGHGVTDCPVTSEEIKRILKLHLQTSR